MSGADAAAALAETLRLFDVFKTYSNAILAITLWELVRTFPEDYAMVKSTGLNTVLRVYFISKFGLILANAMVYLYFFGTAGSCQGQVIFMSLLIWVVQSGAMFIMFCRIRALFARQPIVQFGIGALGAIASIAYFANGIKGFGAMDLPDGSCLSTWSAPWNVAAYYLGLLYDVTVFVTSLFAIRQLMEGTSALHTTTKSGNAAGNRANTGGRTVLEVMMGDGIMHFAGVMIVSLIHTGFLTFAVNPVMKVINSTPDTSFRVILTLSMFRGLKMYKQRQAASLSATGLSSNNIHLSNPEGTNRKQFSTGGMA